MNALILIILYWIVYENITNMMQEINSISVWRICYVLVIFIHRLKLETSSTTENTTGTNEIVYILRRENRNLYVHFWWTHILFKHILSTELYAIAGLVFEKWWPFFVQYIDILLLFGGIKLQCNLKNMLEQNFKVKTSEIICMLNIWRCLCVNGVCGGELHPYRCSR